MKPHQFLLSAILLLLIGIILGIALMLYSHQSWQFFTPTEVQVTEVKRSISPPSERDYRPENAAMSVREIAAKSIPTVVYIETTARSRSRVPDDENHQFDDNFWDNFAPRRSQAIGSGVIISPDGFILTNNHVVAGGRNVKVTLHDKREFEARIIGTDPSTDLAVLKIEGDDLSHITLGNSDHVQVGDWVYAVGNPLQLRSTITAGIVSALSRDVQIINDRMRIESFIQTDAAINKGNSGGALVNREGELIGINTAIATESGMNQGYGFAIPINLAFKIARDLMQFGEVKRAFLGVQIASVDQSRARQLEMPAIRGVEIVDLIDGGAARTSGLQQYDVILSVNDMSVDASNQLQAQIALYRPGDTVTLKIWRNKQTVEKEILLMGSDNQIISSWLEDDPTQPDTWFWGDPESFESQVFDDGFTLAELHAGEEKESADLFVIDIVPGSIADVSGIRIEDLVIEVNGEMATNLESFSGLYASAREEDQKVELMIVRDGEEITIEIIPQDQVN